MLISLCYLVFLWEENFTSVLIADFGEVIGAEVLNSVYFLILDSNPSKDMTSVLSVWCCVLHFSIFITKWCLSSQFSYHLEANQPRDVEF